MNKVARDTGLVFRRSMGQSLRNPVWLFLGIFQPLLYLFLFGPLLKTVAEGQGFAPSGAYNLFVPGLLVQLALFTSAFVGFSLVAELRAGVIERLQVTPISRGALLLGRMARDFVALTAQALILVVAAIPLGLRVDVGSAAGALVLVLLIGASFSAISYALALALRSEDALAPVLNGVAVPLLLLSGIFLPMSLAPGWLGRLADLNPLSHVVDATRALFNGELVTATVLRGTLVGVVMAAAAVAVAGRGFRRAAA